MRRVEEEEPVMKRDVKDERGWEEMRRNEKRWEGIRRDEKGWEGMRRDEKGWEKENLNKSKWGGGVVLLKSLKIKINCIHRWI